MSKNMKLWAMALCMGIASTSFGDVGETTRPIFESLRTRDFNTAFRQIQFLSEDEVLQARDGYDLNTLAMAAIRATGSGKKEQDVTIDILKALLNKIPDPQKQREYLNVGSDWKQTALILAAERYLFDVIKFLKQKKVDVFKKDITGKKALDYISQQRFSKMYKFVWQWEGAARVDEATKRKKEAELDKIIDEFELID